MTTVIIGAGVAGTFAAQRLQQGGEDVVVLEATEFLGGRTRTDRVALKDGASADLGASWLDRGQDRLLAYAIENNIRLEPEVRMFPKGPGKQYSGASILLGHVVVGGKPLSDEDKLTLAEEVQAALDATPPTYAETIEAWGRRVGLSSAAFHVYTAQSGFNPLHRSNVVSSWHVHPGDIGRVAWLLTDGTDTIARTASAGLDIRYGNPVRLITRSGRGYQVVTETGDVAGDNVIVTSSVSATRRIGFDPVLPSWKVEALLATPMTQGGKAVGRYRNGQRIRDALWPTVMTDGRASMLWMRLLDDDTITVLATVPDTGDGMLEDESALLGDLDRQIEALTGVTPERIGGIVQNWTAEEFFGGVVSMGTGGAARRAALAAPVGGIHFAGEATSAWASAMEAAARSGERAADAILAKNRARSAALV
jgi:monoamine oxidase